MTVWRVFLGVLAALLVFSLIGVVVTAAVTSYAQQQAQDALDQTMSDNRHAALRRQQQHDAKVAHDRASRALSVSQRCIGGTVIEQHGSEYVQLTNADHRPVTCTGRFASEPIR